MYNLLRSFLFLFDAEKVHYFSMDALKFICKIPQLKTADMTFCATQNFKAADTKLNQLYQQLLPIIKSKQKQRLTVAQRTWIKFRDETCDYSAEHFEGGSLSGAIYISCKARVTEERIKDLEGYLEQAKASL